MPATGVSLNKLENQLVGVVMRFLHGGGAAAQPTDSGDGRQRPGNADSDHAGAPPPGRRPDCASPRRINVAFLFPIS